MANGEAMRGLCDIVKEAGASWWHWHRRGEGLPARRRPHPGSGINIQSLAIIDSADENGFVFRED